MRKQNRGFCCTRDPTASQFVRGLRKLCGDSLSMGNQQVCLTGSWRPACLFPWEMLDASCKYLWLKGKGPGLTRDSFKKIPGITKSGNFCADMLFRDIDTNGDGKATFIEICEALVAYRDTGTPGSLLRVLFDFYDHNADGVLSRAELEAAMQIASPSLHPIPRAQLDGLVSSILERFDFDKDGALNYTEFSTLMRDTGMDLTG